jgi:putative OPT family oligopeptide transporter
MPKTQRQLTLRATIAGMALGGFMSLSNLYVGLKAGMGLGVSITAGILAYVIFELLRRLRITKTHFGMLENNAMQSVASAAGYMTGGGTIAAIPALMMLTGESMGMLQMFFWISSIAFLGVVMAIPMKQQLINIEQLRFPSGVAAAETIRALHGEGEGGATAGSEKARLLGWSAAIGAFIAFFRDAKAKWMPFNLPEKISLFPSMTIAGRPLMDYTMSLEGSVIMLGAGAIMGFRAAWSLLLGAVLNYTVLAPWLYEQGIIPAKLGYKSIVGWSVWFGSSILLTSGLLAFALQWKTVVRAMKSVTSAFHKEGAPVDGNLIAEVPMSWFFWGVLICAPVVVFCEWYIFGIKIWMGIVSVFLSFFIALVASRVTGETDTTPSGPLGKITQITYGILDPGNVTTNLMTANVTGGVGLHAADLLTDLKSGYLLKADPRQQFWAQFFGVLAGSFFVVPAYHLLIPDASVLGGDQWPAPAAQTWKGVAELLAKGVETLHPTARLAILAGAIFGVLLVILEQKLPQYRKWIPSASAIGLGFTTPGNNTIAMFLGALIAFYLEKQKPQWAERGTVAVSSGFIAGESLMGVVIAALVVMGMLS